MFLFRCTKNNDRYLYKQNILFHFCLRCLGDKIPFLNKLCKNRGQNILSIF